MSDDIFTGPALKIKRAYHHIQELEACVQDFLKTDFFTISVDEEPNSGNCLLKFSVTKPIPEELALCIGDAAHNLRSALDLLMCGIISRSGGNIANSNFPFHGTRENLAATLENGEIKKVRPDLVQFILDTVKPFKTVNFGIWALNKLDIVDKHRLIVPVFAVTRLSGIYGRDDHDNMLADLTVTVERNGTINMISIPTKLHILSYGQPAIAILFDNGQPFEGKPVVQTLNQLAELTTSVIESFRAVVT